MLWDQSSTNLYLTRNSNNIWHIEILQPLSKVFPMPRKKYFNGNSDPNNYQGGYVAIFSSDNTGIFLGGLIKGSNGKQYTALSLFSTSSETITWALGVNLS